MDFLALLEEKLGFIEKFYDQVVNPFETTIQKINDGEAPYDTSGLDPEDADEPPFLDEWVFS